MIESPLYHRIVHDIQSRKRNNLFRTIPSYTNHDITIDLSTNSYLSIHKNPQVAEESDQIINHHNHGNCASRLISQYTPLYQQLETEISSWEKTESALIFNSGYSANVGILQALSTRHTEIFCDRLNHASIYDGILLSGAKLNRYHHCDMADLENRLKSSISKEKIIVTDTVFSMDGDIAPLIHICELAEKYKCLVMVDEAHATGILGKTGSGLVEEAGVENAVDIRVGTLSKAIAGLGGYFAGSSQLRDFFINHSRSLIYSTGLPHSVLAFALASIRYIRSHCEEGKKLLEYSSLFRKQLDEAGFNTMNSATQIVPCKIGDTDEALKLSFYLRQNGIIVPAIRPSTVPEGTARLRFSVSLDFTPVIQQKVLNLLKDRSTFNG